jgi:hypothetical protein
MKILSSTSLLVQIQLAHQASARRIRHQTSYVVKGLFAKPPLRCVPNRVVAAARTATPAPASGGDPRVARRSRKHHRRGLHSTWGMLGSVGWAV